MSRVFVAMSGGVDSSVAAALLLEQGHDVTGVTMRLADEGAPGGCCPSGSVRSARLVCAQLGIPHYTWDLREAFAREVVEDFVGEYVRGRTPNPCVRCNDRVKFGALLERVIAAGGEYLATGHYARVVPLDGGCRVARGADPEKDQSYFLYRCTPDQLQRTLFPVGGMRKGDVRAAAHSAGLPSAEASESQEACFLAEGDVRGFVRSRHPEAFVPGDIVDERGARVGVHDGVAGFTVGQRRGTGGGAAAPRYVTSLDVEHGRVTVGTRGDLGARTVRADDVVWHGGEGERRVTARIRYRGAEVPATARLQGGVLEVTFDDPVSAPAPGQALVCWDEGIVIGGGVIEGAA